MLRRLTLLGLLVLGACSSSEDTSTPTAPALKANERLGDIKTNDVWKDGTKLVGVVRIFEGATVEIEPGATISCADSAQIQVGGTLRVKAKDNHAKITCPQWSGIVVAQNGALDIQGLDIENASVGYQTTKGAGLVNVSDASILTTTRPFTVGVGSTLNLTRVKATTPTTLRDFDVSVSEVYGSLVAKYLDYEANTNEGIMTMRDGQVDIEDSTLKAKNGLDLISSYGGKSVKVRYTTMTGAHCGPHVDASKDADKVPTGSFEFDHVTSEGNIFGVTVYAAAATGSLVIKDSNFAGERAWLDLQGDHGPITFSNNFFVGDMIVVNTDPPDLALKATARIDAAKPR